MPASDQNKWAKALLLKIHVITGWTIEQDLMPVLTDQFEKKLIESYPDMNPDEIEFAFRREGTTIEDWGKAMNLALIDKVLIPYRNTRYSVSNEIEARYKEPEHGKVYTEQENRNFQRAETEAAFQRILKGNFNFIPRYTMIDILKHDGLLQDDNLDGFLYEWINSGKRNIYKKEP